MKAFGKLFFRVLDIVLSLLVYPSAWLLKSIRAMGVYRMPHCKNVLLNVGVFPIRDHYYEPRFDHRTPNPAFSQDRDLGGIDWNVAAQLEMMERFKFSDELLDIAQNKPEKIGFYLNNGVFESGDAEYWYQIIRAIKPKKIIEVGGGNSTLMALKAIDKNRQDDPVYRCEHICIEPYEMPWLEAAGVSVFRSKVEEIEPAFFSQLRAGDILFIDSSHVIRPQGDVLFEYLELLPSLEKGVIVHVHDIFSPKNYPKQWMQEEIRFWNEQYLLEAFLSHNSSWAIIGALNYLRHHHYEKLKAIAPFLTLEREPGSFYIQKIA